LDQSGEFLQDLVEIPALAFFSTLVQHGQKAESGNIHGNEGPQTPKIQDHGLRPGNRQAMEGRKNE